MHPCSLYPLYLRPGGMVAANIVGYRRPIQFQRRAQFTIELVLRPLEIAFIHLARLFALVQGVGPLARK